LQLDYDNKRAIDYAIEINCPDDVVYELVVICLPNERLSGKDCDAGVHGFIWVHAVQHDKCEHVVERVLGEFLHLANQLIHAADS
jgi:hypothetical protein